MLNVFCAKYPSCHHIFTLGVGYIRIQFQKNGFQTPNMMDLSFGLKIGPSLNFVFSNYMDCQSLVGR
jgi:hypothetical protein